jgi:hypothetical protein
VNLNLNVMRDGVVRIVKELNSASSAPSR